MQKKRKKKREKFYSNYDKQYRDLYAQIEKFDKKMGWKSVFFAIIKYQTQAHPQTGYNFKNKFVLNIKD